MKAVKNEISEHIRSFFTYYDIPDNSRILCAVSGGIDSVVMLKALYNEGFLCAVAHCNFNLRGAESDGDEVFVKELAEKLNVEFFGSHFDTKAYATQKGISIQMAAREMRYEWFESIIHKHKFDYLALAHHADDSVETALINLARGTGIAGITGIQAKTDMIIRPFIGIRRHEIVAYAKKHRIKYRNDSSNNEVKYQRNLIRHRIIPLFEEMNPGFVNTMLENLNRFRQSEILLKSTTEKLLLDSVVQNNNQIIINLDKIPGDAIANGTFFSLLRSYHITAKAADEVLKMLGGQSGSIVHSGEIQILHDRNTLIIRKKSADSPKICQICEDDRFISEPLVMQIQYLHRNHLSRIPADSKTACIDFARLQFPLTIRKWNKGDKFVPIGMSGFKKLSDFFTDLKMSRFDKESVYLLCSGSDIVWVIGLRLDDRYKINPSTENVMIIKI